MPPAVVGPAVPRDETPRRRREPAPDAPPGIPGGYLTLVQPNLFWREWELEQGETLLARIERAGWRRYRVETADGSGEARFDGPRLALAPWVAVAERGGAGLRADEPASDLLRAGQVQAHLTYRSDDRPHPLLADHDGPLALFGDLRGSGFHATGKVWAADRLLATGRPGVLALAACVLVLRERPGPFR